MRTGRMYRIARLLEAPEKLEKQYNFTFAMDVWLMEGDECGTVGCIAGLTEFIYRGKRADLALDLSIGEAKELFVMGDYSGRRTQKDVTSKEAAEALRNMARTGMCKWGRVLGDYSLEEER